MISRDPLHCLQICDSSIIYNVLLTLFILIIPFLIMRAVFLLPPHTCPQCLQKQENRALIHVDFTVEKMHFAINTF